MDVPDSSAVERDTAASVVDHEVDWARLAAMAHDIASGGEADRETKEALLSGVGADIIELDGYEEAAHMCARFWDAANIVAGRQGRALAGRVAGALPTPVLLIECAVSETLALSRATRTLIAQWRDTTEALDGDAYLDTYRAAVRAALAVLADVSADEARFARVVPIDCQSDCCLVVSSPNACDLVWAALYIRGTIAYTTHIKLFCLHQASHQHGTVLADAIDDPTGRRTNAVHRLIYDVAEKMRLGPRTEPLPCGTKWVSPDAPIDVVVGKHFVDMHPNTHTWSLAVAPPFAAAHMTVESLRATLDVVALRHAVHLCATNVPCEPPSIVGLVARCAWCFGGSLAGAVASASAPHDVLRVVARSRVGLLCALVALAPDDVDPLSAYPFCDDLQTMTVLLNVPIDHRDGMHALATSLLRAVASSAPNPSPEPAP